MIRLCATKKLIEDIMVEFNRIDVLINNAGITKDNLVLRMTDEDFQKVKKVNMNSVSIYKERDSYNVKTKVWINY